MTGQQLKNAILALAVQGKLVPQNPQDEPAAALLERVKAEKARLVKAGKIKKEKTLPPITDEEKPFEIPKTWEWIRLGACSTYGQVKRKATDKDKKSKIWSLDLEEIEKDTGHVLIKRQAIDKPIRGEKVKFEKGDILYSKLRPYLKKILVAEEDGICTTEIVPFKVFGNIDANFLAYVLRSPHIDYEINAASYGAKMPRVGTDTMLHLLIPIPPLVEQKRIVEKIEELLPRVSAYDEAEQKLYRLDTEFPDKLKKSILQQAFTGKMTSKWRKDNGRSIGSWKWVTFGELGSTRLGKMLDKGKNIGTDTKYLRNINVRWFGFQLDDILTIRATDEEKEKLSIEDGDLLICEGGEPGRCAVWTYGKTRYIYQKAIHRFRPNASCLSQFIAYYMYYLSVSRKLEPYFTGVTFRHLTGKKLASLPVYLPPLDEQKCIVDQVEEYFGVCDKMSKNIDGLEGI